MTIFCYTPHSVFPSTKTNQHKHVYQKNDLENYITSFCPTNCNFNLRLSSTPTGIVGLEFPEQSFIPHTHHGQDSL